MSETSVLQRERGTKRKARQRTLNTRQLLFCREYVKDENAVRAYQEIYGNMNYFGAAQCGSKLLKNSLVRAQIQAIQAPTAKTYSPETIRLEFARLYERSKSEMMQARCLENLAKINGMFIEKSVNINANIEQSLPSLKDIPVEQLEAEFIKRMKLEHTGIDTFKRLPVPQDVRMDDVPSVTPSDEPSECGANVSEGVGVCTSGEGPVGE